MKDAQGELVDVLRATRSLLALPENDFAWSQWVGSEGALRELDELIAMIESGVLPERSKLTILFAPTGSIQEVSISSGWGVEFIALSQRFDDAESRVYDTRWTRLKSWFGLK